ncbi:MAG: L-2-hydroxyglutarate oxidase [Nitrospirales bacterium]
MKGQFYDVIIIGGGVLGCAIARSLAAQRCKVLLLEKEPDVGLHTSGRNSGIVHSGFHATPGSLTARLCVEGNYAIRKYAESRRIPIEQVGTYVVATDESQVPVLEDLKGRGDRNGVPDLRLVPISKVRSHEPHITGHMALFAPTGAIIDSRALTKSLVNDASRSGATILYWQEVVSIQEHGDMVNVVTRDSRYTSELVINCAGLHADRLAHAMGIGGEYLMVPFRGIYFTVMGSDSPIIRSTVYPIADLSLPFLGVHVTRTLQGSVLVGPSVIPAFGREAYQPIQKQFSAMAKLVRQQAVWKALFRNPKLFRLAWKKDDHPLTRQYFWKEASKVIQGLQLEDLALGSRVGISPQLIRSDGHLVDDLIVESTDRTIHVLNMVSPGMTCSLAFAKWLTDRMQGAGSGAKFKTSFLANVS